MAKAGVVSEDAAPHVLIADGDPDSRAARETQLRAAGFRVSIARTGFEAIVKASYHVPDLILLDDTLPDDLQAADTGRLLTTCPVTAHIPIVKLLRGRSVPRRLLAMAASPQPAAARRR
jgi:two-component system, OmpR family, response regulator